MDSCTTKNNIIPIDVSEIINGEEADDPHRLTRRFLSKNKHHKYHHQEHYRWMGNKYQIIDDDELNALLNSHLKSEFDADFRHRIAEYNNSTDQKKKPKVLKVTKSRRENVKEVLQSETLIPASKKLPVWLNADEHPEAEKCIAAENGIVCIDNPDELIPPTPDYFTDNYLPFSIDSDASCNRWMQFLREVFGDDAESISTLQEVMGYLLFPDTTQQKLFLFVGEPRSGKGTIARLLSQLLGNDNVANPSLSTFDDRFALEDIHNKTLATIGDLRLNSKSNLNGITSRLLEISGGDKQTVQRKFRTSLNKFLKVRFLIMSNELPSFKDDTGVIVSRFVVLRFRNSFLGREDTSLDSKLSKELPGIFNWCIEGYLRLRERKSFIQPKSSLRDIEAMKTISSPIRCFLDERCETGDYVTVGDLYREYMRWSQENGFNPLAKNILGAKLLATTTLEKGQKVIDGKKERIYKGIKLK